MKTPTVDGLGRPAITPAKPAAPGFDEALRAAGVEQTKPRPTDPRPADTSPPPLPPPDPPKHNDEPIGQ